MTVKIHTPTVHECTQAEYNLNCTKYLQMWHEHIINGTKPLTDALQMWSFDPDAPASKESRVLLDDYHEANPLANAPRPVYLDNPGDLILDNDIPMTVMLAADEHGNPVEVHNPIELSFDGMFEIDTPAARKAATAMMDAGVIPFIIREPDGRHHYMVKTEEVDGKKYSFYRPCLRTEKPQEGEELVILEKALDHNLEKHNPIVIECNDAKTVDFAIEMMRKGQSHTSVGVRTPIPEGSFQQPTVVETSWGPKNFQFKY